jgi:phospholipid N-methyltransferase
MQTSSIQQHIGFFKESLKNLRATGSIAPSSPTLCKHIASKIDPLRAKVVVELGPGDGVVTKVLLERLQPDARLILFEINPVFVSQLETDIQDPRVTVIHDGAENMARYFHEMHITKVDYVVSGIPFTMLPETLVWQITQLCHEWLRIGGQFIQFHYNPILLNLYKKVFGNANLKFVALNIPPAVIISCEKTA